MHSTDLVDNSRFGEFDAPLAHLNDSPPAQASRLILVVDDEPAIRRLLHQIVSRQGYSCRAVASFAEATAILDREEAGAAILDLWLNEVHTGLDVLRWMRSAEAYRDVPVLILTGNKVTGDQETVIRSHGATVFYKPLRQDSLVQYLQRVVPLPASAAPVATRSELAAGSSPEEDDTALALHTAARDVQRTVRNYRGVLELRERQLENAAAAPVSHRREQQLRDTLQGLVADLDRYAADLRPSIASFSAAAERLRTHFAGVGKPARESNASAAPTAPEISGHVDRLKLARSHRQSITQAKDVVEALSGRREEARAAVSRLRLLFDQFGAALEIVEAVSIDLLVAHGMDPRTTH